MTYKLYVKPREDQGEVRRPENIWGNFESAIAAEDRVRKLTRVLFVIVDMLTGQWKDEERWHQPQGVGDE